MTRQRRIESLIARLNEDLARKLGNIIRYNYQAAKAAGRNVEQMRQLLRAEAAEELDHAAELAELIVDMGGEPTTTPVEFDKPHCRKAMLELDAMLERDDMSRYLELARLAADLEEVELQARLEAIAAAEGRQSRKLAQTVRTMWPSSAAITH